MKELLLLLPAVLLAGAILFGPRQALRPFAMIAVGLVLVGVLWTWSFANSCSSDGCIGVFFLGALGLGQALLFGLSGAIRWALLRHTDRGGDGRGGAQ